MLAAGLVIGTQAVAAGVDELPQDIQKTLYNKDMLDPMQPIGESAYRDWKPKKGRLGRSGMRALMRATPGAPTSWIACRTR